MSVIVHAHHAIRQFTVSHTPHMQLLKQKSEYAFSLSSQVEAKNRELQQQEDLLQQEKARAYHTSKELQEVLTRKKVRRCSSLSSTCSACATVPQLYRATISHSRDAASSATDLCRNWRFRLQEQIAQQASLREPLRLHKASAEKKSASLVKSSFPFSTV